MKVTKTSTSGHLADRACYCPNESLRLLHVDCCCLGAPRFMLKISLYITCITTLFYYYEAKGVDAEKRRWLRSNQGYWKPV